MKEYIVKGRLDNKTGFMSFTVKQELIRCEDCKWGREISGNIECNADMNNPPEYHGYKWFCPLGERKEE